MDDVMSWPRAVGSTAAFIFAKRALEPAYLAYTGEH